MSTSDVIDQGRLVQPSNLKLPANPPQSGLPESIPPFAPEVDPGIEVLG